MILTCPECATSYFVDDGRVPPEGRVVKCSSCSARWRATPQAEPEPEPNVAPAPHPEVTAQRMEPPAQAAANSIGDLDIVTPPAREAKPKAVATKKSRAGVVAILLGLAASLVLAVGGAILFRDAVARAIPGAATAYAAIGLPVGRDGLVIEAVATKAAFQGGRPVLSVTGSIHNTRGETTHAPILRVSLLDHEGKPIAARLARPLNAAIPGGARRYFAIAIADPPAGSRELEVTFDEGTEAPTPAHGEPAAAAHAAPDHG